MSKEVIRPLEFEEEVIELPVHTKDDEYITKMILAVQPKQNDWALRIGPSFYYVPEAGHKVRFWHRWFMWIFFGLKWVPTSQISDDKEP